MIDNLVINHKSRKSFNIIIEQRLIDVKQLLLKLDADGLLRTMIPKKLKERIENIREVEVPVSNGL